MYLSIYLIIYLSIYLSIYISVGGGKPPKWTRKASQALRAIRPFRRFRWARPDSARAWYQPWDRMKPLSQGPELLDSPTATAEIRGISAIFFWMKRKSAGTFQSQQFTDIFYKRPPPQKNTQSESNSFATHVDMTKKGLNNIPQTTFVGPQELPPSVLKQSETFIIQFVG